MKSIHLNHGSIHAVIYPKRGTGVMLLPGIFLTKKDQADDYEYMVARLAAFGFAPELDPEVVPAVIGNVECIQCRPLE